MKNVNKQLVAIIACSTLFVLTIIVASFLIYRLKTKPHPQKTSVKTQKETISMDNFMQDPHKKTSIKKETPTQITAEKKDKVKTKKNIKQKAAKSIKKKNNARTNQKTAKKKNPQAKNISLPKLTTTKNNARASLSKAYGTPLGLLVHHLNKHQKAQQLPAAYGTNISHNQAATSKTEAVEQLPKNYGTRPFEQEVKNDYRSYTSLDNTYSPGKKNYSQEMEHFYDKQKPKIRFGIDADTFFMGTHNQALLNESQNFDKSIFFQTIVNVPINITIPEQEWGKVEFNFTGRMNTVWGSSELSTTTNEFVKIGRAITETKHYHDIDRPIFWVKETWLKLFSKNEKSYFQIGFFPKQIGLGLVLGNHYKVGNPATLSTIEKYIDQYRPGLELSTTFGQRNYNFSVYYSMYKNYASFDRQVEFAQSQELCECGEGPPFKKQNPSRPLFQASHLITSELDIPFEISKSAEQYYNLHIKPFIMYNKDRNQTVEFAGDAESSLVTIGSTFTAKTARFEGCLDIAGNVGFQEVKGWDRNVTEEHARMTQTHLFALSYQDMSDPSQPFNQVKNSSGSFVLSPTFPYPPGEDISLKHAAGEEFVAEDPALQIQSFLNPPNQGGTPVDLNTTFLNSYSRFRKCYRNTYRAFMVATDMAYHICDNKKINFGLGYAGGDDNPNDSTEKAILYRLREDWDKVRKDTSDHCYSGFTGVQSLYTGKHLLSMQLLRSQRMNQPLSQVPELTANQFSNLIYGGIGMTCEKEYNSGTLKFSTNVLAMGMPHSIKYGFDPVIQDVYETFDFQETEDSQARFKAYDERLEQYLGTEFNALLEFYGKNNVTFYGLCSIFLPGSYYNSIRCLSNEEQGKNIPLKNQYTALAKDISGFENAERNCISLQNSLAVIASAGIRFEFDTSTFTNPFKKRRKK